MQLPRPLNAIRASFLDLLASPIIILLYHRVADLSLDPQMLAVSPVNFYDQISFLKDHFPVIRLEDDWGDVREPSIVITFDDGYADNVQNALPIIDHLGVPATFFVTAGYIDSEREFWWDELEEVILHDPNTADFFAFEHNGRNLAWPTTNLIERYKLYEDLLPLMKKMSSENRDNLFALLRTWSRRRHGSIRLSHRTVSTSEVCQLAACTWATIGSHGESHRQLAACTHVEQREEIMSSKSKIEALIGSPVTTFSYPFGGNIDFSPSTAALVREAGYVKAVANIPGQVRRWSGQYTLPRHLVRNWTLQEFQCQLKEFKKT